MWYFQQLSMLFVVLPRVYIHTAEKYARPWRESNLRPLKC